MNEFTGLKLMLNNVDLGIMSLDEVLEQLQKEPIKTYEERAKIFNYDLRNLSVIDKSVIEELSKCTNEVNEMVKKRALEKDRLKEIVDKAYLEFYGYSVFYNK
ncbi:MAG: hypothetical protein QXD63_01580 [Candidatus Pacearchaeota archaeon]